MKRIFERACFEEYDLAVQITLLGFCLCLVIAFPTTSAIAAGDGSRIELWDTQWILPVDTGQYIDSDIDGYFAKRRQQGFDVIMTGATQFGLRNNAPLLQGGFPFQSQFVYAYDSSERTPIGDITAPNPAAWDYVGHLIDRAGQQGLAIALLPMSNGGSAPYVASLQSTNTAFSFGVWLGQRFADKSNLIWVLGGDVCAVEQTVLDRTTALAQGIRAGGANQPMTAHFGAVGSEPNCDTSGAFFPGQSWLNFSMLQSTVPSEDEIDTLIRADVQERNLATGTGETVYEDFSYSNGSVGTPNNIRHRFFRTIFNGGFYFAYGQAQTMLGCLADPCLKYGAGSRSWIDYISAAKNFLNQRGMRGYETNRSLISSSSGEVLAASRGASHMVYLAPGASAVLNPGPVLVRVYDLAKDLAFAHPSTERTDGSPLSISARVVGDDAPVTIDPLSP